MRAVTLSVFLLFLVLLTGSKFGYGNIESSVSRTSTQKIVKCSHTVTLSNTNGPSLRKNLRLNDNREDFITLEDDDDLVVTRKLSTPVKLLFIPDYASTLVTYFNFPKNRLPFCKHFSYTSSCKYILQRVLRI
jgi:hypothetical protein